MRSTSLKKLVLSAMFMAIGIVLPLFTAQIKEIGDSLLPMHFPVLLCGAVCGPWYGLAVGGILPFFRSVTFGMPPLYPTAVWMAAELAAYGGIIGIFYRKDRRPPLWKIYLSLLTAMLGGRAVWGIVKAILLGTAGKKFTVAMFFAGGFIDALPGIILQLLILPFVIQLLQKNKR